LDPFPKALSEFIHAHIEMSESLTLSNVNEFKPDPCKKRQAARICTRAARFVFTSRLFSHCVERQWTKVPTSPLLFSWRGVFPRPQCPRPRPTGPCRLSYSSRSLRPACFRPHRVYTACRLRKQSSRSFRKEAFART